MPTPAAEVDVTPALVRRLLAAQHPDLADRPMSVLANGWDNVVVRIGDDLLVRLPRRRAAAALIEHEQRWLPTIADLVRDAAAVPTPVRVGRPTADYPWSWSVVPYLPGTPAFDLPAPGPLDPAVGTALGRFLVRLHVAAPPDAPRNPVRGVPLRDRADVVASRLADPRIPDAERVRAEWEAALAAPEWDAPPVWLHGDLHPLNLLVDHGRLVAVVDFGDVTAGDPATDLATAWLTFGPDDLEARHAFRTAAAVDGPVWERARGWAIVMASALVAASDDHPRHHALGVRALQAVVADRPGRKPGVPARPDRS